MDCRTEKRLVGAFDTNWAGQRLKLRHQPNVSGTLNTNSMSAILLGVVEYRGGRKRM
jgi:hypothetical protein